jgi:ankyrin repeat protein
MDELNKIVHAEANESEASVNETVQSYTSAQQIWDSYIDGERDMREDHTYLDRIGESLESYKKYYEYRFNKRCGRKNVESKGEIAEHVTRLLFDMSRDPHLSSFLIVQVLPFGADANFVNQTDGESILHNIARFGNDDALKCILSLVPNLKCDIPNKRGQTPLILASTSLGDSFPAASSKKIKTVKLLLEQKECKINYSDSCHRTALFYSFQGLNLKPFRYLLKKHASVVSTLTLYVTIIPELLALDRALKHGSTAQQQMQNIRNSVNLRKYLSHDEVSDDMIDYHQSYGALLLKVAGSGKVNVMKGMLLFRIREELRHMKLVDPPILQNKFSVQEKSRTLVDTYQRDLMIRNQFKAQHKKEKSDAVRERKQREEKQEWDERRAKTSARLEKEFDIKVKGLFV